MPPSEPPKRPLIVRRNVGEEARVYCKTCTGWIRDGEWQWDFTDARFYLCDKCDARVMEGIKTILKEE
jgi:hypothetical protein